MFAVYTANEVRYEHAMKERSV